ncbi:MAG: DUF6011 domain-containing protein, partial [Aureliella sp.]
IAKRILAQSKIGPSLTCAVCWKALVDDESRQRGIGPDCWQTVLAAIEAMKSSQETTNAISD